MSRALEVAAKGLDWLEFWGAVTQDVIGAIQALHRKTDGDPAQAKVEIRKMKDRWAGMEDEDAEFQARLDAVDRDVAAPLIAQADEPEHAADAADAPQPAGAPDDDDDEPRPA